MIRTIIIDDEPSAVSVLELLLSSKCKNDVEVIASCNSPFEGKDLILQLKPDLVFMDIEMPGLTGIELARSLSDIDFRVVFVTAYDDYAIQAFELNAINYLLKPIGPEGLVATIEKVKSDIEKNKRLAFDAFDQLDKLLSRHTEKQAEKIGIAMSDKIVFLSVPEIVYCEAQGGYTNIYLHDGTKILSSKSLGDFETQLSAQQFFRIHHSFLINLNRIKEFQRNDGGYVIMENGKSLEVSQRKRKDFMQAINKFIV